MDSLHTFRGKSVSHAVTRCISEWTNPTPSLVGHHFCPPPILSACLPSHSQVPVFLAVRGLSDAKWASVVDSFRADVLSKTTNSTSNSGGLCACLFAACASSPEAERNTTLDACRAWLVCGFWENYISLALSLSFSLDLSLSFDVFLTLFLFLSSFLLLSLYPKVLLFKHHMPVARR